MALPPTGVSGDGTSDFDLKVALHHVPHFVGVFANDTLPPVAELPVGSSLIANYSSADSGGSHWIAMGNLNRRGSSPWYFDSYGAGPDELAQHFKADSHFLEYMWSAAKRARKAFLINKLALQCHASDLCGEFCVFAIRANCLPLTEHGRISSRWREIVGLKGTCKSTEGTLKRRVKLSRAVEST